MRCANAAADAPADPHTVMNMQRSLFDSRDAASNACVRFGTSSFSAPGWLGTFYPRGTRPGDFLRHYATQFDTVEIDATYYSIPSIELVDGWARKTPERFVVAAKFPRSIVHAGGAADPDPGRLLTPDATYADRDAFLDVMSRLGARLGPLLLQFPFFAAQTFGTRAAFCDRLERFLDDLPVGFSYAVEVRNRDWLDVAFAELCRRHRVALVLVDRAGMPHGHDVATRLDPVSTDFAYVRLLGDRARIERITTDWTREVIDHRASLERWADLLAALDERQVPTWVFTNNHYAGHAPTTVRRLQKLYHAARDRRRADHDANGGRDPA